MILIQYSLHFPNVSYPIIPIIQFIPHILQNLISPARNNSCNLQTQTFPSQ